MSLVGLFLENNQLSGNIPAELGQLGAPVGALTKLYLDGNQLSGKGPFQGHMEEHHAGCDLTIW
jgi:hypothetical protein